MNYRAIYERFIAGRREREAALLGYFEKHHVVPRTLGGDDDASNIIRLTAEDHFFAHLLLAKIHGGKLWAPVAFMVGGTRKDYKPIQSRKRYGWVLRAMAKRNSGQLARQYDWTVYELEHKDGRIWSGHQSAMHSELGIKKSLANILIKHKCGSALGWHLKDKPAPRMDGEFHPMYRKEIHTFLHVDGRRFVGTQHELHISHGIPRAIVCQLARGKFKCAHGWYIEGTTFAKVGRGAKWGALARQSQHSMDRTAL